MHSGRNPQPRIMKRQQHMLQAQILPSAASLKSTDDPTPTLSNKKRVINVEKSVELKSASKMEENHKAYDEDMSGRERLSKLRVEVAGKVWIPDTWGQEDLLKDWVDCSVFDSALVPRGIVSARAALVEEGRRSASGRLSLENSC